MPDVQEVFRVSTQKIRPEPEALERQHGLQRRTSRNRKTGTFALVAALIAILVAVFALVRPSGSTTSVPAGEGTAGPAVAPGIYSVDVASGALTPFPDPGPGTGGFVYSPDGTTIAYTGFDDSNTRNIFTVPLGKGAPTQVTHEPDDARQPAWSPDGTRIAYVTSRSSGSTMPSSTAGSVRTVNVRTGSSTTLVHEEDASDWLPDWSPDGSQITFARDTGEGPRLQVVSSSGGAATPLVPDEGVATYDAMWSPDGAQVAFSQQDGDLQNVYVLDVATGQIRMIAPGWLDGWVNGTTVLVEV